MSADRIFPVLLAGGVGERMWPISRREYPKQFLPLFDDGESLLQRSWRRAAGLAPADRVLVVGNREHGDLIRRQLPALDRRNLLLEPIGRDTAPAVLWSALELRSRNGGGVMAVAPADHAILSEPEWLSAVAEAADCAAADDRLLVLLASERERPDPRFGQILCGKPLARTPAGRQLYAVSRFVEKPDPAVGAELLAAGRCLRSMGTFACRVDALVEEFDRCAPEVSRPMKRVRPLPADSTEAAALEQAYREVPRLSVDRGILERSTRLAVLPSAVERVDVGDYSAFAELWPLDARRNAARGRYVGFDSADNIVYAPGSEVVTIGMSGFVVAVAGDAVLICPRDRTQDIKRALTAREEMERGAGDR